MAKSADAAAIAASVKKSNADAAAMGVITDTVTMPICATGAPVTQRAGRGSREAREAVELNLGKRRHRRGWCSL
jgi:hypothetical protein